METFTVTLKVRSLQLDSSPLVLEVRTSSKNLTTISAIHAPDVVKCQGLSTIAFWNNTFLEYLNMSLHYLMYL